MLSSSPPGTFFPFFPCLANKVLAMGRIGRSNGLETFWTGFTLSGGLSGATASSARSTVPSEPSSAGAYLLPSLPDSSSSSLPLAESSSPSSSSLSSSSASYNFSLATRYCRYFRCYWSCPEYFSWHCRILWQCRHFPFLLCNISCRDFFGNFCN